MSGNAVPAPVRFGAPVDPPPAGKPWTVLHLLRWSAAYLLEKGVDEGRLDAEYLLSHVLEMGRLELYLHFERPLTPAELARFKPLLLERSRRKPLQYILGRTAFRELELKTDRRVLIPRPETEELVEAVLARVREWGREGLTALDLGTGSGAIALSLALEGPFRRVVATDRSPEALALARENAGAAGVERRVEFREGNLFQAVTEGERFHVVVSNPPYVTAGEYEGLAPEVREWEPREALVAEGDGLALLHAIVEGAPATLEPGGLLALEMGAGQGRAVTERVRAVPGYGEPVILRDLARQDRMVLAEWRP